MNKKYRSYQEEFEDSGLTIEEFINKTFGYPLNSILMGGTDLVLKEPIEENIKDYLGASRFYINYFIQKSKSQEFYNDLEFFQSEFETRLKNTLWCLENDKHRVLTKISDSENKWQLGIKEKAYVDLIEFQEELYLLASDKGIEIKDDDFIELQLFFNTVDRDIGLNTDYQKSELSKMAMGIKKKYTHRPYLFKHPDCFIDEKWERLFLDYMHKHVDSKKVSSIKSEFGYVWHRFHDDGFFRRQRKHFNKVDWLKWLFKNQYLNITEEEFSKIIMPSSAISMDPFKARSGLESQKRDRKNMFDNLLKKYRE